MTALCNATLGRLAPDVARPGYDRSQFRPGIVHLGIGAFMRAHLAAATEAAINRDGDMRWGIVGVSLRQADTRDALSPQDGLYTLALRDADDQGQPRQKLQVIGCVMQVLVAPESPQTVLEVLASPDTRIASLTVTEKGYCHDPASARLRLDHPDIAHDLVTSHAPRTAIGFLVHALALRRARGLSGLTLMSLDNLPANGKVLRGAVLDFAARIDAGLASWIKAQCTFPCSMVDRIVPRTTDADRAQVSNALGLKDAWPVMGEPFMDWAIEDHFAAGRPDWRAGGARFVEDAAGWERLKLRMVNGSHSCIAYLGAMAGWATVDRAIAQPALRRFIDGLMREEIEPTLPPLPGLDLTAYRTSLLRRFANPALAHRTHQIAMDGSQKIPQRLLATVRERLAAGTSITRLSLGIAAWLHYLRGRDEAGASYPVDDPLALPLCALAADSLALADPLEQARRLTAFKPVFGDLAGSEVLAISLAPHLERLRKVGVAGSLVGL